MAPMVITTVGIAHAHEAGASLVVWPALYELLMLFTSPATDWEAVSARALRRFPPSPAPRRLALWLGAEFTISFGVVVLSGAGEIYLRSLVGVPEGPSALALQWAPVLLVVPALWVARAHLHGVLMAAGATAVFGRAGAVQALVLAGTVAVLGAIALPGVVPRASRSSPGCSPTSASRPGEPGLVPRERGTTRVPERAGRSPSWPSPPPPMSSTS